MFSYISSLRIAALICVFLFSPTLSWADSDGAYCVGDNYIAYELGLGDRKLSILKPSEDEQIVSIKTYPISGGGFNAELQCTETEVLIAGFNTLITFNLEDQSFVRTDKDGAHNIQSGRLGDKISPAEQTLKIEPLSSWETEKYRYQLHIIRYVYSDKEILGGPIEHHTQSRIVRIDNKNGLFTGSYDIYDGFIIETVH